MRPISSGCVTITSPWKQNRSTTVSSKPTTDSGLRPVVKRVTAAVSQPEDERQHRGQESERREALTGKFGRRQRERQEYGID